MQSVQHTHSTEESGLEPVGRGQAHGNLETASMQTLDVDGSSVILRDKDREKVDQLVFKTHSSSQRRTAWSTPGFIWSHILTC